MVRDYNSGGGGEIRTHGRVTPTAVFKTAALNRSATPPHFRQESYLFEPNFASKTPAVMLLLQLYTNMSSLTTV